MYYDPEDTSKPLSTTVGQLNFFKWAIENNIIDYVKKSFNDIKTDLKKIIDKP